MPPNVRVLGGFLDQRIEHVVDGDDAQHLLLRIDHRDRQQVVAADQPRDFLLVHQCIHCHRRIDLGHVRIDSSGRPVISRRMVTTCCSCWLAGSST